MIPSGQPHSFERARRSRLAIRTDLKVVQRASSAIVDLGVRLEAQLENERRPTERLRMLRETTNRITRTANDAVHAYRRAIRAVDAERARPDADVAAANEMRALLEAARLEVLRVLELAKKRYPWTDDGSGTQRANGQAEVDA